jgi:hypothetical protein
MKIPYKLLSTALISTFIIGCSSVNQYVPVANTTATIPAGKAIVVLHRPSSLIGAARSPAIYDNQTLIGDIGSGTKLIWERDTSYMCLSIGLITDDLHFLVNPLLLALEAPKHPGCFKIEEGKVNEFTYDLPAGKFHYQK